MNRGFTLIETIITTGISVVALVALVNLFLIFNSIYGYQHAFMATAGSASDSMNAIETSVMSAGQVIGSRTFQDTLHSSATTTLVLELPAIDTSGNIISEVKDYVVFYASSTILYRLTEAGMGSSRPPGLTQLSTTLQSISFTYDDNDFTKVTNVTADIQTQAQFKQQDVRSHLRGQTYLRNFQPSP